MKGRVALLDVNVLLALFNPDHVHHEPAHDWFADNVAQGWATCPLTENAFLRIVGTPTLERGVILIADVCVYLREFCTSGQHEFWGDAVSIRDDSVFDVALVRGHRQLTDVYLLGLAVKRAGRLVTFDRSIPLGAVKGATRASLEVISPAE